MQIWQPAHTGSAPVLKEPQLALDPLIQMVLTGSACATPLPVYPWWQEAVELEASTQQISERQRALPPPRTTLGENSEASSAALLPLPHHATLSAREQEILLLVAEGLPNKAIADRLIIAESTVKWYLKQIYLKLDVHNRVQALARMHAPT